MLKVIEGHEKALAAHFGRKIGFLGAALPLEDHGVYPAADFAADCIRRWARTSAAIIGIAEPAAGFSSGPVTTGALHRAFPLDSSVVFVKIRGEDLERALAALQPAEISVSGLRLFLNNGALDRVQTENGQLIPGHVYQVAVPDSLASGRDNPVLYSAAEFVNSKRRVRDVMSWCFSLRKPFSAPAGGRIINSEEK
jgi:2',3'-cyclic-nucleotide 2'-phosphodiesterase (5'-nucleotidase family)